MAIANYADQGIPERAEVASELVDTLVFFVRGGGKTVAVEAGYGFIRVLGNGGQELVARTALSGVTGTDGRLAFKQAWPRTTYDLAEDYVAEWEYKVNGEVQKDRQFFDVVLNKLPCSIDQNNLRNFYPDICEHLKAIQEEDPDKFCRQGWSLVLDLIRSGRNRPSLILDRVRLVNPATQKALMLACRALSRDVTDIWTKRAADADALFNELWAGLGELKYDRDEDGFVSEGETKRINRRRWTV